MAKMSAALGGISGGGSESGGVNAWRRRRIGIISGSNGRRLGAACAGVIGIGALAAIVAGGIGIGWPISAAAAWRLMRRRLGQ